MNYSEFLEKADLWITIAQPFAGTISDLLMAVIIINLLFRVKKIEENSY
jgi:hypothetical protein